MGNAQVMTAKAAWDNGCYWAISALLYFQRRYTDPAFMASIDPLMRRFFVLHARMQQLFRAWDLADRAQYADGFTNVTFMERLFELQTALGGPRQDDDALRRTLAANLDFLERFAWAWQNLAATTASGARPLRPASDRRARGHLAADVQDRQSRGKNIEPRDTFQLRSQLPASSLGSEPARRDQLCYQLSAGSWFCVPPPRSGDEPSNLQNPSNQHVNLTNPSNL